MGIKFYGQAFSGFNKIGAGVIRSNNVGVIVFERSKYFGVNKLEKEGLIICLVLKIIQIRILKRLTHFSVKTCEKYKYLVWKFY